MYVTGDDGYQNVSVSAPMLSSVTVDNNKKIIYWISTGISSETIKPFDTKLKPTMSNLANGKVNLKVNNSVLVKKNLRCIAKAFEIYL